ncbi:Fc.00g068780.m01.CDS01 [Cosmosporella sp. VM-42]
MSVGDAYHKVVVACVLPAYRPYVDPIQDKRLRLVATQPQGPLGNALSLSQIPKSTPRIPPEFDRRSIREKLGQWAVENGDQEPVQQLVPDTTFYGKVSNSNSRPQSTGSSELDVFRTSGDGMPDASEGIASEDAELSIVGSTARNPGDLVEMKHTGSRTPIFAIYLGYFGDRNHFYSSNGKWVMSLGFSSIFTVANFASLAEIKPLISQIPIAAPDDYEQLRKDDKGPSREAGAELIRKMNKFETEADNIYQTSLTTLDRARSLISDGRKTKYMSLFDIADILLPKSLKKSSGFTPSALYAVHKALYRNDFVFRPLSPSADCHRRDHIFEIFPYHDTLMINRVSSLVREYTMVMGQQVRALTTEDLEGSALGNFILKARELVQASRAKRPWTQHGIVAPSSESSIELETSTWSKSSQDIIRFLEWWACYDLFDDASRFHAYGSLILRSLALYPDVNLDQSTAWTFLQEIGAIPPWEIPSRYKVRFPNVKIESGGGLIRNPPTKIEDSKRPDIATGFRREWRGDNVFCIDAPSTVLIDDGVSLERTEKSDEFWIHVHAADPASGIQPKSELGEFMELIPENIYLPGHFQAMLPSDLGAENSNDYKSESLVDTYSLAAGRPALTFSAKVNEAGELLDYKIEPGVIEKVHYLDPADVSEFCNEPAPLFVSEQSLTVGTQPEKTTYAPNRPMTAAKDLDESSKEDIRTLYKLAEAIKQKRLDKGAWPYFFPRPSVTVSFPEPSADQEPLKGVKVLPPDPYIKIGYESSSGCSVVSNSMVLAGEIAARWCSDRCIPLPYRKDVHSSTNLAATLEYATKEIYPLIKQGIEPKSTQRQELNRLTGGIEISSTPGPYFMLGLDMYAKATSPLRRFSDLIVHWQIHAALAHERSVQRRIDSSDNLDEILPFTSTTLPTTLSLLHMREKMARAISHGIKEWILIALVRAWRFENSAPRSLRFTVTSRWRQGLMGRLDFFDLDAIMDIDGVDDKILLKDVKVGDQFDVELADVNVHSRNIFVKTLRYLGSSGK